MKKFLLIFSLLILSLLLSSETIIDYTDVYGVWNTAGSPYVITTDIEIPQGQSLTIDAGVTVVMNPDLRIIAYGVINVNGTEENIVHIQGITETTAWLGIEVNSENGDLSHINLIGAKKGIALYKTNSIDYCNIIGYGSSEFQEGLYVGKTNQSTISNVEIYGYMTGVTIKGDEDDDDEPHGPTTPTMDVIRIYYSPDSWKGERTTSNTGIYMDSEVEPTLTNIEIENYDQGIVIKADEDDDDEPHGPTTPTMDVIRIYYSPDSWKGDRTWETEGIYVEGKVSPSLTDVEIENYDKAITIKADEDDDNDQHGPTTPTMDVIRIYYSPDSWKGDRTWETEGIYVEGKVSPSLTDVEIENYDKAITIKADEDDDNDQHGPTTPTMDVIRIYYSPDSWKGDRTWETEGIYVEGKVSPSLTDVEIENYDKAITIKADEDDDNDQHGPTTPTMDVIRIYYSPDSWKGDRTWETEGIYVEGKVSPSLTDVEIENYDKAITIKADEDDDNDQHGPTTPTMDVIRIYYSPDSWKGDRTWETEGIYVEGKVSPSLTDVEIENYDKAITIKADDDDDNDQHGPTTPTMDVIRIYYSPDSWKSDRNWNTVGIFIDGSIDLVANDIQVENYESGIEFKSDGTQTLSNILIPNVIPSWNNYGVRFKGENNVNIENINVQNYDNAIYGTSSSDILDVNIINAVISNYNSDRSNTKAIYFKGAVNLLVDNSHITDYDQSIYLKNNYNNQVNATIEHTEIYQTEARRGNYKGIQIKGKVTSMISNNVVKSCDPAITIDGSNANSLINRNLVFITYEKNNSKAIDVKNINDNVMKHNTLVNYEKAVLSQYTPSELVNNIIWNDNPDNNIVSNYSYIEARYNNISLPNGEIFPGIENINELPDFVGSSDDNSSKEEFADKFVEFQLNPTSPCIDAGDPTEEADSDGTIPDLGVFEFVGNKDLTQIAEINNSLSNYPNPFNPTTNILFNVTKESNVEIKIYNIKGQVVKSLLNENRGIGSHRLVWNGDNNRGSKVASGIYFVRMKQDNINVTRKILLTK